MTDKEISVSLSLPTLSVSHPLYLSQFLIPSISFSWYLVCKLSIGLQRDFQSEGAGLLFSVKSALNQQILTILIFTFLR